MNKYLLYIIYKTLNWGNKKMKKNKVLKIISILLIAIFSFSLAGCTSKASEDKISNIKKSGKLVVGTSADFPPYEFHKEINGKDEIVGFDIKIAEEVAKDLGVKLEVRDMKFDGLLAALSTGKVDLVLAGMSPTEKRKKSVDFSNIYYTADQCIMVREEDKDKLNSIDDLKGKNVGVQKGSMQEEIAQEQIKGSNIKGLSKVSDLVLALKNKKVDAVVVELVVANAYIAKNPGIAVSNIKVKVEDEGYAIALKKGSKELVDAANKTIERLQKDKSIDKFVTEATEASGE